MNKQKLIDTDNRMVVTSRKGDRMVVKSKGIKYGVEGDLTLGGGQYTDAIYRYNAICR